MWSAADTTVRLLRANCCAVVCYTRYYIYIGLRNSKVSERAHKTASKSRPGGFISRAHHPLGVPKIVFTPHAIRKQAAASPSRIPVTTARVPTPTTEAPMIRNIARSWSNMFGDVACTQCLPYYYKEHEEVWLPVGCRDYTTSILPVLPALREKISKMLFLHRFCQ